jgi:hypothetical protein
LLRPAFIVLTTIVVLGGRSTLACDFCGPVNLTLSEEIGNSDVALIATMVKLPEKAKDDKSELTRAVFHVEQVLKGGEHLAKDKAGKLELVHALYFGDKPKGTPFLLLGVNPPKLSWSGPPLTEAAVPYVAKLPKLPSEGADRLAFFQEYLEDKDRLLAQDAYDEFAKAPYSDFKALRARMNREKLLTWLGDKEMLSSRKRLYMMMLSVCGKPEDTKMLKELLLEKPKDNEPRLGLEPVIVAYLMLSGNEGMKLIDELFMANKKAHYADMYAAIMALRFMGQEQEPISRKRILQSFHHILDRADFADLVIPDLARWEDWSVMDRLVELFKTAKGENSWVRVPVVQYLSACPLPKAKDHLAELEKIDPEAIKRASFILPLGRPTPGQAKTASPAPAPVPVPAAEDDDDEDDPKPAAKKEAAKKEPAKKEAAKTSTEKRNLGKDNVEKPAAPPDTESQKRTEKQQSKSASAVSPSPYGWLLGDKALVALCTLAAASLLLVGIRRARKRT